MFTGIIGETGVVRKITKLRRSARITVEAGRSLDDLSPGESISVNGVCLTVAAFSKASKSRPESRSEFSADVSDETLSRTTLGDLKAESRVNLERAARLSDRMGGHLVSGHVDGTGTIRKIEPVENSYLFYIELPKKLLRYCIEKGSIAIDGISLTINRLNKKGIYLMIIPHTMKVTNLSRKKTGDRVNVENDLIAKYVERFVKLK